MGKILRACVLVLLLTACGPDMPDRDEKGTEAAAATSLAFPVSKPPPPVEMTMDRPFLFAIMERETGTILFLGRVTDPS